MKHISHYINSFFGKFNLSIGLYIFILLVFLTNTLYVSYPDEFVNMLGGKFILAGKLPYKDFFDHHLPFAWYLSAVLQIFSFGSYVLFRIWWALVAFTSLFGVSLYIKKNKPDLYRYYLAYFFLYPFLTVYYWTHLYIADSLAFLFFSVIFWLLITETFQEIAKTKTLFILSFLNFLFVFSSLTFIFIAGFFYIWMLYLYQKRKINIKRIGVFIAVSIAPYVLYGLFLLVTGSLKDFYISNFVYNTKLYIDIPNYVKGRFFNPLKFGFTIIFNFYQSYLPLLVRIKEFNLYFPVDLVLALGSFLFLVFSFFENKILFMFLFFILSFTAPRSNLMKIGETDYQSGMFIAFGMISTLCVLWRYKYIKFKEEYLLYFKKISTLMLVFFFLFASLFLVKNGYDKFYLRYTQQMPGIYDVAYTASFTDEIIEANDYFWIGPYEPHEAFFVRKGRLPGKFPTLLPQFREDHFFKSEFLRQFENNPPKIIIYKHEASIFMTPAMEFGAFFVDWMKAKYTSIENISGLKIEKSPSSFNLKTDLYIRNEDKEHVLQKLKSTGYITY